MRVAPIHQLPPSFPTRMARKVLCECCNKLVTPAVAKKHREERAQAEYLLSLGRAPVYVGNPTPPITAESVFGHTSTPPLLAVEDTMDIDTQTRPPSPSMDPNHLPLQQHTIQDDDFRLNEDMDDDLSPPELYNEHLENLASEEFRAFENIRYGLLSIQRLSGVSVLITPNRGKYP